ncbi:hypothetical protein B5P45_04620 [Phyllobacterium zundukense]|uniref:Uncharacterized protein n=1 Tax=Phyllobacterium zundukense TaxID=1867719 RepID=A0A2N9W2R4_9HYPH|nr:hypothetical protein B5P45_04620 [Phyllobacterium zundukense]
MPRGLVRATKVAWTVSVIAIATALGALLGWENHGLIGAIALGFVGFVVGIFVSYPSMILQLLT